MTSKTVPIMKHQVRFWHGEANNTTLTNCLLSQSHFGKNVSLLKGKVWPTKTIK